MHLYCQSKYSSQPERWPVSPEFIFEVGYSIKAAIQYCKRIQTTSTTVSLEDIQSIITCLETYIYIYSSCLIREDVPIVSVDTNMLYEFWTEFTSYWNLFCKLELEGLYLFILSCRTIDSFESTRVDQLFLSKYTIPAVLNTLTVLYPFEPKLEPFISFLKKANLGCIYFSTIKITPSLLTYDNDNKYIN